MGLLNCWNWKNCGRYPGGPKAEELGVCPAATDARSNGFLGGRNAGRSCIFVKGTLCGGSVQGTFEEKKLNCMSCDYYIALKKEFNFSVSSANYHHFIEDSTTNTDNQLNHLSWISPKVPPEVTAKNAKKRYKK